MTNPFECSLPKDPPPGVYRTVNHKQPPVNAKVDGPLQTNNTFNNLLLEDQTFPTWPLPYLLWVTRDGAADHGMALNHTLRNQFVYGPDPSQNPAQFYFNPPRIKSWTFSGRGWASIHMDITKLKKLFSEVELTAGGSGKITMPLAYGMAFATAIYEQEVPVLASAVGIQDFKPVSKTKYVARLFDGIEWSIYTSGETELVLEDPNHVVARNPVAKMVIQVAKGNSQAYDSGSMKYPKDVSLEGSADLGARKGKYALVYDMEDDGVLWALPHQQKTLTDAIQKKILDISLDSPTKGVMKLYRTNRLEMQIDLPVDIRFDPWTSVDGFKFDPANYTPDVLKLISQAAAAEVQQDVAGQCDLDSMYFAGKQLDKYAYIAYVAHFVLRDLNLSGQILPKVKQAIEKFANNQQKNPLQYDQSWKGVISAAPPDQDFGNSNYNDHHFHYGYHIHAIALVANIDPSWLSQNNGLVLKYANTLIRDFGNPSNDDSFFPQSRNFDWYHGHSFAHGIFPSGDGKNEESSSEDYHSIYGLKLFGHVTGNDSLVAYSSLILGIMRDSLNMYMLYSNDNVCQPEKFRGNKVSGILFENKIDFATFFGRGTVGDEFIHGIHMIPITPVSSYIRGPKYVKEEWDAKLSNIVDQIPDGWRGLLYLNYGLFDPRAAWKWFTRGDWQDNLIDGGMSKTWSLAYIAGIGGSK